MANTKSTQHEIDLTSSLNLNKFKADIKAYEGFNERNAPYYGGCLSPLYIKNNGQETGNNIQFYNGNRYSMQDNNFCKNGTTLHSFSNGTFTKERLGDTYLDILDETYVALNSDGNIIVHFRNSQSTPVVGTYLQSRICKPTNADNYFVALEVLPRNNTNNLYLFTISNGNITYLATDTTNNLNLFDQNRMEFSDDGNFLLFNSALYRTSNLQPMVLTNKPENEGTLSFSDTRYWQETWADKIKWCWSYYDSGEDERKEGEIVFTSFESMVKTYKEYTTIQTENNDDIFNSHHYETTEVCTVHIYKGLDNYGSPIYEDVVIPIAVANEQSWSGYFTNATVKCIIPISANIFSQAGYWYTFDNGGIPIDVQQPTMLTASMFYRNDEVPVVYTNNTQYCYFNHNVLQQPMPNGEFRLPIPQTVLGLPWTEHLDIDVLLPKVKKSCFFPCLMNTWNDYLGHYPDGATNMAVVSFYSYNCGYPIDNSMYQAKKWSLTSENGHSIPALAGNGIYFDDTTGFRVLATNTGDITGISWGENRINIGTLLTSWGSVDGSKSIYIVSNHGLPHVIYYDSDEQSWCRISYNSSASVTFKIIGNLAVFDTSERNNCINLDTNEMYHWASDWNNRINVAKPEKNGVQLFYVYSDAESVAAPLRSKSTPLSSAQNPNWLNPYPSSATFAPIITYSSDSENNITALAATPSVDGEFVDVYNNYDYFQTINSSDVNGGCVLIINSGLVNSSIYPAETRLNIPLFFTVTNGLYDLTIVSFGKNAYAVIYYDTKIRYQYTLNSVSSFDIVFVIQGQAYGVVRDKIYSISYSQNTIQGTQPVTTVEGLQFIGATIYNAYFYSQIARIIYVFSADNSMKVFSQADTFAEVTGAAYIPSTGSILIGVNEEKGNDATGCLYILNENFGIYRVNDIKGFSTANISNDGSVICITNNGTMYQISYEPMTDFTKKDIILDTAYYGAGSNVVSVNDCWYVRVTDPEHNTGEIKLQISTLTDIGRQTETKIFKIKENDWDELTDTVYLRYQPKLQRAVGVSLHIESPFKIGYIGVGATPETLQLNKGTI